MRENLGRLSHRDLVFGACVSLFCLMGGLIGNAGEIPANLRPSAATAKILKTLHLVADWQIHHLTEAPYSQETSWTQATFYLGLARLAATSGGFKYFRYIRRLEQRNKWRLGPRLYHADDHAIGQVYVAAFDHYADVRMIAPMLVQFDHVLASKPNVALAFDQSHNCQQRWCWSDALFMAPASWMAASRITRKRRYRDYADAEYWVSKAYLFDSDGHLFFRDSRFFDQRGPNGEKIFWGRGNGWVFAGLINILHELPPDHPSRLRYEQLFIEMADTIRSRQRGDGFWATSLMSPLDLSIADSSATAFFTYGIASGVSIGLLNREQFAASALLGWDALVRAVGADGRLGQVQQIGDAPGPVDVKDSQPYGSGALLLAGLAIKSMIESEPTRNHGKKKAAMDGPHR